jgi:hypothetical protein
MIRVGIQDQLYVDHIDAASWKVNGRGELILESNERLDADGDREEVARYARGAWLYVVRPQQISI